MNHIARKCIGSITLSEPLGHKAEVKGMLLTEYNEAEQMELFK